jgi:aminoglycoside phosphotransferase (APT) family kinase protein
VASFRHPNHRPQATLPPELRRLKVHASALAWTERNVGSRVVSTHRLAGASTSAVHRLRLDDGRSVVLRRYVWPFVLEDEPVMPEREVSALLFAAENNVAAPQLIAADVQGTGVGDGVPALLMDFVPGRALVDPDVGLLARVAASIHTVDPTGFPHEYFEWFGAHLRIPSNATKPKLWERGIDLLTAGRPPYSAMFIHRDFHPGNVLWWRGQCSGVVDWANACAGPSGCDVGHCRTNLLRLAGIEVADRFRAAYEDFTGEDYHPYWEVAAVFDHGSGSWAPIDVAYGELRLERALAEVGALARSTPVAVRPPGCPPADRPLTAETVASLVVEQFPSLSAKEVRFVGSGWDNDVFLVDDTWAFRFPRRADGLAWFEREIQIMSFVEPHLGDLVPCFQWLGHPTERFPYPFVGYRWLPGTRADQLQGEKGLLAQDLGKTLSQLHSIDTRLVPSTPAAWEATRWSANIGKLSAVAPLVRPLLSDALREQADPYLSGMVPPPVQRGSRRFVHNDICPDHILVDPTTGRLAGLIDFADAMVADPVLDFVGLIGIGDRSFIDEVVAHYTLPLDDGFSTKLEWLSRVLTLRWLADATVDDPAEIPDHVAWVARSFEFPESEL